MYRQHGGVVFHKEQFTAVLLNQHRHCRHTRPHPCFKELAPSFHLSTYSDSKVAAIKELAAIFKIQYEQLIEHELIINPLLPIPLPVVVASPFSVTLPDAVPPPSTPEPDNLSPIITQEDDEDYVTVAPVPVPKVATLAAVPRVPPTPASTLCISTRNRNTIVRRWRKRTVDKNKVGIVQPTPATRSSPPMPFTTSRVVSTNNPPAPAPCPRAKPESFATFLQMQ